MPKDQSKPKSGKGQRALVVGVSDYPNAADRLPAVAADVREMAKVLSSKNGSFPAKNVTVLADKQATRDKVLEALSAAFEGAGADETVFVYLAGHGAEIGGRFYYVAYDTDDAASAVPLTEIKRLFDATKSRRAFLWLDFCHSGGILARGATAGDIETVRRAIGVVSGQGKVIVAACTSAQASFESEDLGHGLFTHALLRGLRGDAASAQGEVTAHSLYEFIDRQVANVKQQPVFFGETTGRIVLAHYSERATATDKKSAAPKPAKAKPKTTPKRAGTWVMLGDAFLLADTVRQDTGNKIEVKITTTDGETAAIIAALKPGQYGGGRAFPFAENNEAQVVRVENVESESSGESKVWTLALAAEEDGFRPGIEVTYNVGGRTYTPDDVARLRAGRVLLNDPAPREPSRGFGTGDSILGYLDGSGRFPLKECVVRSVYHAHTATPDWKTFARLKAVFLLKAAGVVEHVLDLTIGTVRSGRVAIKFRGRRPAQYSGSDATTIELDGSCPLEV